MIWSGSWQHRATTLGGTEEQMPPQGRLNTGQKIWQLVILGTGCVFLVTGATMWFFRSKIAIDVYLWLLFIHGIAFVVVSVMFLVHIYVAVLHPRMRGSLPSILDGKVSPSYAKRHYRKWYDKLVGNHHNSPWNYLQGRRDRKTGPLSTLFCLTAPQD